MRAGLRIGLGAIMVLWINSTAIAVETNFFDGVKAEARRLAHAPYVVPTNNVSEELLKLSYLAHKQISFRDSEVYWKKLGLPFELAFFHSGYVHKDVVHLNELFGDSSQKIPFSTNYFDYGTNRFSLHGDPGFAGFTIHHTKDNFGEVGSFLGASYFRMIGRGQSWGGSARGLALNTGLPGPEEFPVFKEYWLQRPGTNDASLTLFALLDSPSVSGAFQFVIEPDRSTVTTVDAWFFVRKETERFGVAPLTSMYLYGENSHPPFSDFRPEVHDSDGLLVESKNQDWLWRPLENGKMIRMNSYRTDHLRGFGLLQRDRHFEHYQDPIARFEDRPTIWIKTINEWGEGSVELTQLPSNLEFIDNTVAFWQPAKKPKAGDELHFAYQIFWTLNNPQPSNVATVRNMWIGKVISDPPVEHPNIRFVLDFDADAFPPMKDGMQLSGQVENSDGAKFVADTIARVPEKNLIRYVIEITEPTKATDLRAKLKIGDSAASETWTYTLAAMKSFVPRTGSVTEWNKAYFRLEDFLRAHQVNDKVHQSQLILRMMRIAAERHSRDPSQNPTTLVMQEAFIEMDVWFKQLLPTNNIPPERLAALGRVGMHMMNATDKWPNVFLSGEDLPSEFTHQIYQTTVKAGPDLRISSMIPRPLDTNPEGEVLDEKWERLGKVPLTLVVGASLLFSLGVVLYVFH